jgi:hypothetical protein
MVRFKVQEQGKVGLLDRTQDSQTNLATVETPSIQVLVLNAKGAVLWVGSNPD